MIKVEKYDDGLPISVIIPLGNSKTRKDFFNKMVLPLIDANSPNEVIIVGGEGSAPFKRNKGFKKATQPYVFFCDDDILLPNDHLWNLYIELKNSDKSVGYTYSGYHGIVLHPESHPMGGNFKINTIDFNINNLRNNNFISTMSLIKSDVFPGFDETLTRFQDWDIWLTLLNMEIYGKAVHNNEFYAYYLDIGITSKTNDVNNQLLAIRMKHRL